MIEKELREIKRRFRPEKHNIAKIVGCFVNTAGQIISKINQPLGISESVVSEKLITTMKKTLSGSLGTNLVDISFTTPAHVLHIITSNAMSLCPFSFI